MPKGTRVSRCVEKVKKSKDEGAAIAICQASTKQGYATGKALKEALATKFGSGGSKLSRTSSRHATNPGESAAQAREDARKFTQRHGQQASQTHKQTGKIPGPKPGEKKVEEAIQAALVGIGRVAAGMLKRKAAKKAIASAQGVATGGDTAKKQAELGQQAASDTDLEETKMNNAYVRKLMEMELKPGQTKEGRASLWRHQAEQARLTPKQRAERAQPKKKISKPGEMDDHTGYHQIGSMLAEAMGLLETGYRGRSMIPKTPETNDSGIKPSSPARQSTPEEKKAAAEKSEAAHQKRRAEFEARVTAANKKDAAERAKRKEGQTLDPRTNQPK
jgi:hypothetical protein